MLPERSVTAKAAKKVFFDHLNEIDIFVEDTTKGSEKTYLNIFSRVFEGIYDVRKIFPLGGRLSVVNEFEKNKSHVSKPTLYIVDGDLYLLVGDEFVNQPGLYVVPFYCIENVFIDKDAILKVCDEEDVVKLKDQIEREFDYDGWVNSNITLLELFVEYAICKSLLPTQQTVKYPLRELVSSNFGVIDDNKVRDRINYIRDLIVKGVGEHDYTELKTKIDNTLNNSKDELLSIVSGKDFLFPLIYMRLKYITKSKAPKINIQQRLAKICDISVLSDIHKYVLNGK